MTKDEVRTLLQPFINSYESGLLLPKKCIRLHFDLITKVHEMGVPYKKIVEITGFPMGWYSFTNRMYEIRKERKEGVSANTKTKVKTLSSGLDKVDNKAIESEVQVNSEYSLDDWREAFGFHVNDEVTEDFARDFGLMGLTPENWRLYKKRYNIFNAKRLAQVHANRRTHKFIVE
ncbi:hypothetical protein PPW95_25300 (plasmid) [Vibrio parahaemolyticus]|uniref:hypothetical protein n=1 Tax=Vibrio harveyi group TaxID=717610 RepID=UPI0013B065BA|nr:MULTISPECIES: hypothetical protein [Vibrio harveyi group]WCP78928.1 hypothetical protein PPW95_25300 [Vibrio parahaemolyticus]